MTCWRLWPRCATPTSAVPISIQKAFPQDIRSPAFKDLLGCQLYDYQKEGALFAARAGRCLIGDDMGLGKTIQAIAAAEIMARHLGVERVLVICPTSLKHQWEREISRFTGRDAIVINGLHLKRRELLSSPSFFKITNYDTIHRDAESIKAWAPDLVILDEAQRIKNWNTRAAEALKRSHHLMQSCSPARPWKTACRNSSRLSNLLTDTASAPRSAFWPIIR